MRYKNVWKRFLAMLLCVVMAVSLLPVDIVAAESSSVTDTGNMETNNTGVSTSEIDLFVFAGQSNMMGASVLEPEVCTFTDMALEYKYMPKLRGAENGSFVSAQNPAGEWHYIDLNAAYGDQIHDFSYKSKLKDYGNNTFFCPAMRDETKGFSAQSEADTYPAASLAPYFATEYAEYGHSSVYAHMAKGAVKIVHYFTEEMMERYNALISEYNTQHDKSYAMLSSTDLSGAGDAFDEKYKSMLEDYADFSPDKSVGNQCFIWLQGEGDSGLSYIEYKLKMQVLWEHIQELGFTHFFVLRVGYWGNTGILNVIKAQEDFCAENENCYVITRAPSLMPHPSATTDNWWIIEPSAEYDNCRDSYLTDSNNNHFNEKAMQIFAERSAENVHRILHQGLEPILEEENIQGMLTVEDENEAELPEDTAPYTSYIGIESFCNDLSVSKKSNIWKEVSSFSAASTNLIPVTSADSVWMQYVFFLSEAHAVGGFYDKEGNLAAPLYYKDFGFSLGGGGGEAAFRIPKTTNRISIAAIEAATGKEIAFVRFTAWQASAGGHSNTEARVYHNYSATITAPTCTEQGYTTYTCACGESYVGDYVETTDHTYSDGSCTICGAAASPYLQQLPENIVGCTNLYDSLSHVKGYYTATKYDTSNGAVLSVVIPVEPGDRIAASSFGPVSQNMGSVNGIRVTYLRGDKIVSSLSPGEVYKAYTDNGYITVPDGVDAACVPWWAPSDGNWLTLSQISEDFAIHSPKTVSAQEPTCTESGYTAGEICEICGESLGGREEIAPTGHSYSGDACTVCGAVNIAAILSGKYVSVLGDSISTFNGYSNDATVNTTIGGNGPRYDAGTADTKPGSYCLLESVDKTWWMDFANRSGMELLVNNSWAGSQVFGGQTGDGRVIPAAYLDRCVNLHDNTPEDNPGNTPIYPDVIFVYMGINDYNFNRAKVGTGAVDYAGLVNGDGAYATPASFGEAYGIMLHKMRNAYPDAQIFAMTLLPENLYSVDKTAWEQHNAYIRAAAEYYDIPLVDLAENCAITWENYSGYMMDKIHPTTAGMKLISDCIEAELVAYYKENPPHTHTYRSSVTAPTCTEKGYTTYTCACGDSYVDDVSMDITDRFKWNEGYVISAFNGNMMADKNWVASDYVDISAFESIEIVTGDTVNANTTLGIAFYDANKKFVSGVVHTDKTGTEYGILVHNLEVPQGVSYLRTTWYSVNHGSYNGATLHTFYCKGAGTAIPPLGHDYVLTEETKPNCSAGGTKVYICSRCGESTQETTSKGDHAYDNGICIGCGSSILGNDWIAPNFAEGDYSMVVLPDTQKLVTSWEDTYYEQMQWIADNEDALNIQAVLHMGDMVDNNTAREWTICEAGTDILQNAGIPWMPMRGNHDDADYFNNYYDYTTYGTNQSWFGGAYHSDKLEHTYWFVTVGQREYMILSLGWAPSWDVLAWAQDIVEAHSDKNVILTCHAYMNSDGTLLDSSDAHCPSSYHPGYPDGDDVWDAFKGYENAVLAMGGHIHSANIVTFVDQNGTGRDVTSLLVDRQNDDMANHYGMVAVLTFHNGSNTVDVNWYSVRYDALYRAKNQFSIDVPHVHSHEYVADITVPTCTEKGYTTYTCECGESYVDDYVDALGHTYSNGICTGCGAEHPNLANYEGKVISILSASTSTFAGYIPEADGFNLAHRARYPQSNLLTDVNETWWMQTIDALDAKLGINESWAGSQVLNTLDKNSGDLGPDAAMASITRIKNLGSNGSPDLILFFGAGNDMGRGVPLGSFAPESAPTEVDLTATKWDNFADAYVAALMRLQHFYPDAEIVVMTTYEMPSYVTEAKLNKYGPVIKAICEHYGVNYIDLRDCGTTFDMLPDGIHPNAEGMDCITEAVIEALLADVDMTPGENVVYSVDHELTNAAASLAYYKGVSAGESFTETISGGELSVTVTMGGADVTAECYADGKISIESVTGHLLITARAKYNFDGHLQQLPDELCSGVNLWTALEPENIYYTASGWGNTSAGTSWSVTFPVKAGDRISATSLGVYPGNGSSANGVRVTWFDENGVLESMDRSKVYAEFAEYGYITAPEGAVAINLPMTNNEAHYEVYILNREHEYATTVTEPTCVEKGFTTHTCTICGDYYVDGYVETIWHTYNDGQCSVCGKEILRILPEDFVRYQGGVNAENGTLNTSFTNNWYADVRIPEGAEQVRFQIFKTGGNWGSAFFNGNTYLSGICDKTSGGYWKIADVPESATMLRYGYLYDEIAIQAGYSTFAYLEFVGENLTIQEPSGLMERPATGCHAFSVAVNIAPAQGNPAGYVEGTDYGYIQLPTNYTSFGEPVRLIIVCHGAGANLDTYMSSDWKDTSYSFWTDLGYAVMDMYASPTELTGSDSALHYGNPIVVDCYKKGYDYVMENFNLKQDGVFLIGSSMGGLSSFQIAQSEMFPVLAQVAYCPVIDLFKQAYVNPWTTASYQRSRIAQYFGFAGNTPTFKDSKFPSVGEIEYYKDNFGKTIPYSPILNNVISGDLEKIFDVIPTSATEASASESALYQQLTATHPNPLIIFHNTNDSTVAYRYSQYYVDMVNRSGQNVVLRTFTSGGHNAWANGSNHTVNGLNGNITIKDSQYEAYMFFNKYEEHESHIAWVDPAVAATCCEPGKTQGSHCAVCGVVLLKQEIVPASGHSCTAGLCTTCGYDDVKAEFSGGELSISSAELEKGTLLYVSSYDSTGRMIKALPVVWDGGDKEITLGDCASWKMIFMDSQRHVLRVSK